MENLGPIIFPGLGGLEINPPRGFTIPGTNFVIYYYGIIIGLGLLLAVMYALKRSKQFGLKGDDLLDGVLFIVPFAVICARMYYVFSEMEHYKTFQDVINFRNGGLAIYGGVIGAAIGVVVFAKVKKVSLPAVLDLVALGFLIGQAIGRWGNMMNREAFGSYYDGLFAMQIWQSNLGSGTGEAFTKLREMAVQINGSYFISVHPTFLYESIWNVIGFVLLHFLSKKRQYDGQIALGYVAWYGLGRALIEGLRMDSLYWGPFRASQLLAAVSCIVAVMVLVLMCLKTHSKDRLFVSYANKMESAEEAAKSVYTQE